MRNRLTTLPLLMLALSCGTGEYVLHERTTASHVVISEGRPAVITTPVPAGFDYLSLVEDAPRFGVSALVIRCTGRDSVRLSGRLRRSNAATPWTISTLPDTAGPEVTVLQKGLSWRPSASVECRGDTCTITLSASIENLTERSWLFEELVLLDAYGGRAASTGAGNLPPGRRSYPFWTGTGRILDPVLVYDALEPGRWTLAQPAVFAGTALPLCLADGGGGILGVSGDTLWLVTGRLELVEVERTTCRDAYEYTLLVGNLTEQPVTLDINVPSGLASGAELELLSHPGTSLDIFPGTEASITVALRYPLGRSYSP